MLSSFINRLSTLIFHLINLFSGMGKNLKYPDEWETNFTAKNGINVRFRPVQSGDTEMLWEMFSTLSENSVANLIPPFNRERIEGWTSNIDYEKVLAIVALIEEENEQYIIADASLEFNSNRDSKHKAALGIAVHDKYQNQGIGTALLKHLLNIAKIKKLEKVWLEVAKQADRGPLCNRRCSHHHVAGAPR